MFAGFCDHADKSHIDTLLTVTVQLSLWGQI